MPSRLYCGLILLLIVLCTDGCLEGPGRAMDEEKSPYLIAGRDWVAAHDYDKAMRKFQKALEVNPSSALAHYELGLLNEQHRGDYVSAIYHYQRVLQLRPNAYPADNARVRIASCKQELVKEESLAPVAQGMLRELDQLRKENAQLRRQLAAVQSGTTENHPPSPSSRRSASAHPAGSTRTAALPPPPARPSGTPRSHVVRAGETPFSISRRYQISLQEFMKANPGVEPRNLAVGKRVNIPAP